MEKFNRKEVSKRMFSYVLPSVFSFAVLGLYVFVDAVFVGNMVGELGIAAINTAFSVISVSQALGAGIGIGAGVKYTILRAEGKEEEARHYAGGAFILLITVSAILTISLTTFSKQLMFILGASPTVAQVGDIYLKVQGLFSVFLIFAEGFLALCRNNGGSKTAMVAVISGCISNCFLDWLFIYPLNMGMFGASLASSLGQLITLIILVIFMVRKKVLYTKCPVKEFVPKARGILANAVTPFACVFVPNLSVIIINHTCLRYGGDNELAIYGIVAFLVYCAYMIIQGSTDGAQPLISEYKGKKDFSRYLYSANLVLDITLGFGLVFGIFLFIFRAPLVKFMGAGEQIILRTTKALAIFLPGLLFVGISRTTAAVFYASERNILAYIISFSEPVFLLPAIGILCPKLGTDGIWWSVPAAQFAVALTAFVMAFVLQGLSVKNSSKTCGADKVTGSL